MSYIESSRCNDKFKQDKKTFFIYIFRDLIE